MFVINYYGSSTPTVRCFPQHSRKHSRFRLVDYNHGCVVTDFDISDQNRNNVLVFFSLDAALYNVHNLEELFITFLLLIERNRGAVETNSVFMQKIQIGLESNLKCDNRNKL